MYKRLALIFLLLTQSAWGDFLIRKSIVELSGVAPFVIEGTIDRVAPADAKAQVHSELKVDRVVRSSAGSSSPAAGQVVEVYWRAGEIPFLTAHAHGMWFVEPAAPGQFHVLGNAAPAVVTAPDVALPSLGASPDAAVTARLASTIASEDEPLSSAYGQGSHAIQSSAEHVREQAWMELVRFPASASRPEFQRLSTMPQRDAHLLGVLGLAALGDFGSLTSIPGELMPTGPTYVGAIGVIGNVLFYFPDKVASRSLAIKLAASPNQTLRRSAGQVLRNNATEADVPLLLTMLNDKDRDMRFYAVDALSRLNEKSRVSLSDYEADEAKYLARWKEWGFVRKD